MKIKLKNMPKIIIAYILTSVFVLAIIFFVQIHTKDKLKEIPNIPSSSATVNIEGILKKEKESHANLVYESTGIKEIVSLVFQNDTGFESVIIDTKTGKKLAFEDLIKNENKEDFKNKEIELLTKKYPEFIVNGIKSGSGTKFYYIKDNEMIIYYYNFQFTPEYNEEVTLRINYNEIKDYLKFTPVLDITYENEDGYNYQENKKTIAFTFDDGPSGANNGKILNILAKNKAHATFFMVGNRMNSCVTCLKNTIASGNEIGSHSYEHMNIKKNSVEAVNESLNKTNQIYNQITGDNIKYLRPPYGAYNKTNLENATMPFILWNLDTEDWRYRDKDHIINYIKENVSDGSIVLMHELYGTTVEALEEILPWLYANGYQVVNITELASLKGETLETSHAYRLIR